MPGFDFMLVPCGMKSAIFAGFHSCCPKVTLTPFHTIRVRFLTPSGYGLKRRLDAVVLTSLLLPRVNCRQLSLAYWWIWLMTQRTMLFFTIVYQLVITWAVNQTRLGTNSFLVHVRRSHTFVSHTSISGRNGVGPIAVDQV